MRSAPAFQLVTTPSSVLLTMASSDASTIAARSARVSSARSPLGDVAREALRVDEASLVPEHARVDQDGLDEPSLHRIRAGYSRSRSPRCSRREDVRDRRPDRRGTRRCDGRRIRRARSRASGARRRWPTGSCRRGRPGACAMAAVSSSVSSSSAWRRHLGLALAERRSCARTCDRRPPEKHGEQHDLDERPQRGPERGVHDAPILERSRASRRSGGAADDDREGAARERCRRPPARASVRIGSRSGTLATTPDAQREEHQRGLHGDAGEPAGSCTSAARRRGGR